VDADTNEQIARLQKLQSIRKVVVYAALALLLLSFVRPAPLFIYGRMVLWATAGALSVMEGLGLQKLGQKATNAWVNAAMFFAVSIFPLIARR